MVEKWNKIVAWVETLRPVRVFQRYAASHGDLLANGLSFTALFSIFAALYVGFAVAGLYLESNSELRDALVEMLAGSVPGLIDTGDGGAINLDDLYATRILNWTGVIAAVTLAGTALGWLSSTRDAVRAIFRLPPDTTNFLLLRLKDIGLVIGFGIITLLSAALSVFSTRALSLAFDYVGIEHRSMLAEITVRITGLLLVLAIDTIVLAALFRVLAGVVIPWRYLVTGSLLGAIALGVLKVLGTSLLGGAGHNPLLASFAVIVGLLLWFNIVCRVILLAAAWVAVTMSDRGLTGQKLAERSGLVRRKRFGTPTVRWTGTRRSAQQRGA